MSNYQKVMRVKTLITSILIMFATASLAFAQSNEGTDSMLLAKADTDIPTVRDMITKREDPGDISLLTGTGPAGVENTEQTYESSSLNVDALPLVMSSADKKTVSIVLPPFLYFKTKF